ncbi:MULTISPECIES: hypothetical protein [unclassified Synechococcus]|uniref:hypothetical protein n=1 Tax=unclassified Synechococcus TaxID=2626047 RepID=UPI0012EA27FE|nr:MULTISPECIES: hypothetical protein [unclassified Synechococcus]WFN58150.1 hypothetical protein N4320_10010 [Synechococcus sp. CCFWC 502]
MKALGHILENLVALLKDRGPGLLAGLLKLIQMFYGLITCLGEIRKTFIGLAAQTCGYILKPLLQLLDLPRPSLNLGLLFVQDCFPEPFVNLALAYVILGGRLTHHVNLLRLSHGCARPQGSNRFPTNCRGIVNWQCQISKILNKNSGRQNSTKHDALKARFKPFAVH